jgi:RNA polymerase sigma-70 factor (ECF subfamily)
MMEELALESPRAQAVPPNGSAIPRKLAASACQSRTFSLEGQPSVAEAEYRPSAGALSSLPDGFSQEYLNLLTKRDPATEIHFSSHFGKLLTVKLRYRLRSKELVEDARQETFLRVLDRLRNKGGIKDPQRLGAFVNAVSENVVLELFRAGSVDRRRLTNECEFPTTWISAESVMISTQRKEFLRARLSELSTSDQEMLRQVFVEERDKDEICTELGISRNNLRVRLHRILGRYRKAISGLNNSTVNSSRK